LAGTLLTSAEQQTATAEVLQVISSFPSDLENAVRICGANFGNMFLYDDDAIPVPVILWGV
jgi:hypothetical protein